MFKAEVAYSERGVEELPRIPSTRRIKNKVAIQLIRSWLEDESGYDEQVWSTVKNAIEKNRLSKRNKFND